MKQSPIFSKTYDFIAWLIPLTIRFPRQQRFVMASALQREALHFQELLIEAAHHQQTEATLVSADAELDKIRTHFRLCLDLELISPGQYEHAARMMVEIGNLLGGWLKSIRQHVAAGSDELGRRIAGPGSEPRRLLEQST